MLYFLSIPASFYALTNHNSDPDPFIESARPPHNHKAGITLNTNYLHQFITINR